MLRTQSMGECVCYKAKIERKKTERDYRMHSKRIDLRLFAQYEWAMWMANVCEWVRDWMKCACTFKKKKKKSAPATSARIYSGISRWEMNFDLQRNQPFPSNYIFFHCFSLTNWFLFSDSLRASVELNWVFISPPGNFLRFFLLFQLT